MDKEKKLRGVLRGQFTKKGKAFEALLDSTPSDALACTSALKQLQTLHKELNLLDDKIVDFSIEKTETKEEEIVKEIEDADRYKKYYFDLEASGVRPFGVSLLICGWDERPYLFQCDPSGAYFAWKATAMGKNFNNGKTFLEKRYTEDLELDDAVHTAILTLKEGFEGQMTADNIEVGICDASGFKRLEPAHVKDYLANIP